MKDIVKRDGFKSKASPKLLALCAASSPMQAKSAIEYQESRLNALAKDADTKLFVQNGRVVTEV